jgi:hypothetical protein
VVIFLFSFLGPRSSDLRKK